MGLFSEIGDAFFGGAEKKAADEEQKGLQDASRALSDATATARGEAKALYGGALDQTTQGFQGALDLWSQIANRAPAMVTEGNRGGQRQMLSGLREAHNALLGVPTNYSNLVPPEISQNFNFRPQLPAPMNPVTDLVDQRGVPYDLQNIPYEAQNIMGQLRDGTIDYEQARDQLITGSGYGSFSGLPASIVNRLIANFVPGGSRYQPQGQDNG